jgi:hypothetical protein
MLRNCLRDPIPEIEIAARYIGDAVSAHLSGDQAEAIRLLTAADMPAIEEWSISVMGPFSQYNHPNPTTDPYHCVPIAMRSKPRMPGMAMKRALHALYGYQCCFCGTPVISEVVRKCLISLYPELPKWKNTDRPRHIMFRIMRAQYDHVFPHSRGGPTSMENLVITCAPCNYGRMQFTLAEMGLVDPRTRDLVRSDWDGLERLMRSTLTAGAAR